MNIHDRIFQEYFSQNQPMMIFDWRKAAKIINERKPSYASAKIDGDDETETNIFANGRAIIYYGRPSFACSHWGEPTLCIDGEEIPCYTYEADEEEVWPLYALKTLRAPGEKWAIYSPIHGGYAASWSRDRDGKEGVALFVG